MHPLVYGDYPASMRHLVNKRLPKFKDDEILLVKGSYDFIGINYYTANYAKNNPNVDPHKPSLVTDPHADVSSMHCLITSKSCYISFTFTFLFLIHI